MLLVAGLLRCAAAGGLRADLQWVKSWGYQLQDADPQTLADSPCEMLVIDYSLDGSDAGAYSAAQIRKIQHSGKLVLAYLSIGEAEDYRFYWKSSWNSAKSKFLGPKNHDWPGNYKVKFWSAAWWKKALRPYLDRIIGAGFDGVYLDIIDAYDYWASHGYAVRKSADRMAKLVAKIAAYARHRAGNGFIVCPQNGVGLIDDASARWKQRYLASIDCVGVEDLFFNIWSSEDKAYRLEMLAAFDAAGKEIFNVEYIAPGLYVAYDRIISTQKLDIIPYAADPDRELNELLVHSARPPIPNKMALWRGAPLLRGANIYQRRIYSELDGKNFMGSGVLGPPYTQADFDRLAALGANLVVISHPGLYGEKPDFALDTAVQDNLDQLLEMAAAADLFAVIALRSGPGRSEFTFLLDGLGGWFDQSYLNDSVWRSAAAQDTWVAMWRHVAQRYRANPVVVGYELMVEPNANEVGSHAVNDRLDIWDPETFYASYRDSLYDWAPLYRRISAAIREVDPETPILIGGMGYSAVDWLPYLDPTGDVYTVYTIHQYAPDSYTHQEKGRKRKYPGNFDVDGDGHRERFERSWLESLLHTVDDFKTLHGAVVAATEFGAMRWEPGVAAFINDQMNLFEQHGMNYALWLWESSWPPYNRSEDAFNFRHGPKKNHHRAVAASAEQAVIAAHWRRNWVRPSYVHRFTSP